MPTSPTPSSVPAMTKGAAVSGSSTTLWGRDALVFGQLPPTDVSPKPRFLDVACGTGAFAIAVAALGFDVTATDFSAGMVARLEEKLASPASAGLKVVARVADGQTLEGMEDGSFDVVSSLFGVFMSPDRAAAWRSAWRVLKPGGRLLVTSWDIDSVNLRMARYVSAASQSESDETAAAAASARLRQMLERNRLFRAASFREELEEFGFQDMAIYSVSHPLCFRSGEEFVASRMMESGAAQALAMLDFAQFTVDGVDPFSADAKAASLAHATTDPERHAMRTKPFAMQALGLIAVATQPASQ